MSLSRFETDQEDFWAGQFGDEYIDRNDGLEFGPVVAAFFSRVLKSAGNINSVMEFGANTGLNIRALNAILPDAELSALEINSKAVARLRRIVCLKGIYHESIHRFVPDYQRDFVFTMGVLIHICPDRINQVYDLLYRTSRKYICLAEYYNPTPVEVGYRGFGGKLFKRDFAGDMLDRFSDLSLKDYGFIYHRDVSVPLDDITWFLLEKGQT